MDRKVEFEIDGHGFAEFNFTVGTIKSVSVDVEKEPIKKHITIDWAKAKSLRAGICKHASLHGVVEDEPGATRLALTITCDESTSCNFKRSWIKNDNHHVAAGKSRELIWGPGLRPPMKSLRKKKTRK